MKMNWKMFIALSAALLMLLAMGLGVAEETYTKVGSTVTFGRYEQDNVSGNGKEAIEWVVLEYDEETNRSLLMTKNALETMAYSHEKQFPTWAKSDIRAWLNGDFFKEAFSADERQAIAVTTVRTEDNENWRNQAQMMGKFYEAVSGGTDCEDRVFILSLSEALKYGKCATLEELQAKGSQKLLASPTRVATAHGASISGSVKVDGRGCGIWWLRSPSFNGNFAVAVNSNGTTYSDNPFCNFITVRPVIWLDLNLLGVSGEAPVVAAQNVVVPVAEADWRTAPTVSGSLNLSAAKPGEIDEIAANLRERGDVTDLYLMDSKNHSAFTPKDVKALMDALPGVKMHYTFELYGKTLSTADRRVEYVNTKIGNNGINKVREAMDIMPNLTYLLLDECGVDNAVMGKLREDYPGTKVVWRVWLSPRYSVLTDAEMIHCTHDVTDEQLKGIFYCNDIKYLDLGHNVRMTDISFINGMPNLRIAIIVDCAAKSLDVFANCPDLERLEIVSCPYITDLSPLANCKKLKGLNIRNAKGIRDLTPLYGLENMERLYLGTHNFTAAQVEDARKNMPNCWVRDFAKSVNGVSGNYAVGWRLDKDGTYADWYVELRKIFKYDELVY